MSEVNAPASTVHRDVVIVGGGPVGSTVSSLLRRYDPSLSVLVLEKEAFPRDHVGESQLPGISAILDEMGCWDKVEAAGFPIKIGLSLTWGRTDEPWDFDFYPTEQWVDEPRPARYEGQRRSTAFQVDRAVYDDILLRHAESLGTEVREQTKVRRVHVDGDRITGLELDSGEMVTASHYVDGSGAVGLLRRALGVESDAPKELRNIAVWDYWESADWAVEFGNGATRVVVRSLPYGWMWFIPLGPTRTSIGLICPAEYYRTTGLTPEQLYERAIAEQKDICRLTRTATRRGITETCKDWSHLADRLAGDNWFLAGEAAGFADPILAAGMTLAHGSARDVAYTILELERGDHDPQWLRTRYDERHRTNISQHIRFAQYWYSANGCFTDLQEHCSAIAAEAGLSLDPKQAWKWLSQGGFSSQNPDVPAAGSFDINSGREVVERLNGAEQPVIERQFEQFNRFTLDLEGATETAIGRLVDGRIERCPSLERDGLRLPLQGIYSLLIGVLQQSNDAAVIFGLLRQQIEQQVPPEHRGRTLDRVFQILEAMLQEGWVTGELVDGAPRIQMNRAGRLIRTAAAGDQAVRHAKTRYRSNLDPGLDN